VTVAGWDRAPLVPVAVTRKLPAAELVQESVDVPEPPVRVVGSSVHERPVEFVVAATVTVPLKPFIAATVIVEAPTTPGLTVAVVGLAETVKSGGDVTDMETLVECTREPLVPVTVTV